MYPLLLRTKLLLMGSDRLMLRFGLQSSTHPERCRLFNYRKLEIVIDEDSLVDPRVQVSRRPGLARLSFGGYDEG